MIDALRGVQSLSMTASMVKVRGEQKGAKQGDVSNLLRQFIILPNA